MISEDYLIINKSVLPDYFELTLKVKDLLNSSSINVTEACKMVGISRATYYKYKDYVFHPSKNYGDKIVFGVNAINDMGILAQILSIIAAHRGNVLSIHQEVPTTDSASIIITLETIELNISVDELLEEIGKMSKVTKTFLISLE